ncbi:MAG: 4-alpha-glucanotransferase, partial [Chitinophagaceae bacterium]
MKIEFYLRYRTRYGQSLFVTGNLSALGNYETTNAFPLRFLNDELWYGSIDVEATEVNALHYHYIFLNEHGEYIKEGEKHRTIDFKKQNGDLVLVDSWNDESFYENAFYTAPFKGVFRKEGKKTKPKKEEAYSHVFKVKAPLLQANEAVCLLGNTEELGAWNIAEPILLTQKGDWWTLERNLSNGSLPVSYKYGVFDTEAGSFKNFEAGDDRYLFDDDQGNKTTIIHDAFI